MKGDRENGFKLPNDRAIAQFAPNFTVYLLPPDVVCLYSEDRKFLLHGELYYTLAAAIGEGGRSFREIIRELEEDFPSDQIQSIEAADQAPLYSCRIARFDGHCRRLLVELGLSPGMAQKISRNAVSAFNRSPSMAPRNSKRL